MGKEIKIKAKDLDQLEFEIIENAQKGDWFSIKNYQLSDFENIKANLNEQILKWKRELKKIVIQEETNNWKNSYLNGEEHKALLNSKKDLENQIKNLKEQENLKIENAISKFKESSEYKKLINVEINHVHELNILKQNYDFELKNLKLQNEKYLIENEKNIEKKYNEEIEKVKQEKIALSEELARKKSKNIKEMGEEFENWIQNQYDNHFSISESTKLEKANKIIGGSKPDFIFSVLNDDNSSIEKVIIEAKTEGMSGKTKNQDHYHKLDQDRKNNGAEYSLLISELEPNNDFLIKKVPEYENMFVIRPSYFISFLALIRHIGLKRKNIIKANAQFKQKEEILEQFEEMKNSILSNVVKNIEKNCENIIGKAKKINEYSLDIINSAKTIFETHINTVKNKIENFSISKINKKIEKIEEN